MANNFKQALQELTGFGEQAQVLMPSGLQQHLWMMRIPRMRLICG